MIKSAAFLPVALVLANLSGLAISLIVPLLVNADEYSLFALSWSVGQLTASVAFEWLRFGVLRYSVGADEPLAAVRRGLAWQAYVIIAATMLLVAALALVGMLVHPAAGLVAAVTFYAACQGAFEGRQARARALFDNGFYSISWVMRTFISLVLSAGLAWATGSGVAALFGLAASYPITMLVMNRARALPALRQSWNGKQFIFLARYGFFAAVATNVSMLLPTLLRAVAVAVLGLNEAGGLLLAADLSQKAIAVIGLAVNIVVMQHSIKAAEFGSDAEIRHRARQQIGVSMLFVVPAAIGFYLIQRPFTALLVDPQYLAVYWQVIGPACLAGGIMSFRLFAIDPLFIALGKTGRAVIGPVVSITVFMLSNFAFGLVGPQTASTISWSLVIGLSIGTGAAAILLATIRPIPWPLGDLAKIAVGGAAMFFVSMLVPQGRGILALGLLLVVYGGIYISIAAALNASGIRTAVLALLGRPARNK